MGKAMFLIIFGWFNPIPLTAINNKIGIKTKLSTLCNLFAIFLRRGEY